MNILDRSCVLLLCYFVCAFFISNVQAAEWAIVIKQKAIVYADAQMSASIGFLAKGKKIRVGEKPKNNGQVLPIIIQKKIAYIKVIDIERSSKKEAVENVSARITQRNMSQMSSNRFALLMGSSFGQVEFPESATADTKYNILFYGGGIRMYREESSSTSGLKGALEYMTGTRDEEKISYLAIPLDYYYKIIRGNIFELQLSGGFNYIPFGEYKLSDDFTLNGYGYGAQVGAEAIFKFSKFGIHVEGVYEYKKLMGFKLPDTGLFPDKLEPSINSVGLKALLSFTY